MPKSLTSYSMLISCPSDVVCFLKNIEDGVSSFNRSFGKQNSISIETVHWTKNAYSDMKKGKPAQDIINEQFADIDMLIGVFWTRFGSPTEHYGSGTEEEINRMLDLGKPVILYFLNKPALPFDLDLEQLSKVKAFREAHKNDGLYTVLNDESELGLKIRDELEYRFTALLSKQQAMDAPTQKEQKVILWVDDRPENNRYGRAAFEDSGFEVIPALSTKQALNIISHNNVDIIISDMGRKEGPREGYVLLDELRRNHNQTPFIIFAGSKTPEHIAETKKHGGQGCTNDFGELFEIVSSIILGTYFPQ